MKQNPAMKQIQHNMQPGVITIQGFLGNDPRDLIQILDEDEMAVRELDLSHQQIADKMIALRDAGKEGLGEFIDVAPHFSVKVDSVRGKLRCPFEDPGLIPKTNTTVINLELNRQLTYTDMNIHFIQCHGFYQGEGSPFRLSPEKLVEVLEVAQT